MRTIQPAFPAAFAAAAVLLVGAPAQALPLLGSAQSFSVLAASTITNTGPSSLQGDMGVDPGSVITGIGSITLVGAVAASGVAQQAQSDARAAYADLAGRAFTQELTGQDLGGMTLGPGVYRFASSAQLTGSLTLAGHGQSDATWVFQIGSSLTTASGAVVNVVDIGSEAGLWFQVGSSATLGTGTVFAGNIVADQSITMTTGSSLLCGRVIALVGAVTLDTNTVSNDCMGGAALANGRSDGGSWGFSGVAAPVPEPGTGALMLAGLGMAAGLRAHFAKRNHAA